MGIIKREIFISRFEWLRRALNAKMTLEPLNGVAMHNLAPASFPRFLKQPNGDPRLDSQHPWVIAFGGSRTFATCACCGAGLKRAVIAPATEAHPSGEVFGLDCYATLTSANIDFSKKVAKALTKSKKATAAWMAVFNDPNDRRGLPARLERFGADHPSWKSDHWIRVLSDRSLSIWSTLRAIETSEELDECDRADLVDIYQAAIQEAQIRAGIT